MEEALIENLVLGNDHKDSMKKINESLIHYGLTPNQSKVYLYLTILPRGGVGRARPTPEQRRRPPRGAVKKSSRSDFFCIFELIIYFFDFR